MQKYTVEMLNTKYNRVDTYTTEVEGKTELDACLELFNIGGYIILKIQEG